MIKIISALEPNPDAKFSVDTEVNIEDDATTIDAVKAFIKVMQIEEYHNSSIYEALKFHCDEFEKSGW